MKILLLSDIHANLLALNAVFDDAAKRGYDSVALLGDLINYGMRPNEVIARLRQESKPIICNIFGNHEKALDGQDDRHFATDRGRAALRFTKSELNDVSLAFIGKLERKAWQIKEIEGKRILFMHGDLDDPYWGKFGIDKMKDQRYAAFDYVISGHSHIPHYVEYFFPCEDVLYRNKKRTVFINPGSVGQPRNHNPRAQYGILDTDAGEYSHYCAPYDIKGEQEIYTKEMDSFYKERLALGI